MDSILKLFLETQAREASQLAADSDLVDFATVDLQHHVATFRCRGLVRDASGAVREHDRFSVGIFFPDTYQRLSPFPEMLTWLEPRDAWHPNVKWPFICIGPIARGTPLVELLHRCYEVISYENVTMVESNALNPPACAWARRNRERFPIDSRPLKRPRGESASC